MTKSSFYPGTDYEPVDPPAPAPAPPGSGNDAAPSSFFKGSLAYDAVDESDFVGPPGPTGPTGPVGPTGPAGGVASVFARTGAVVAVSGDYTATQITNTPAGAIAAVTVQAALNELDTEKAPLASPTFTGAPAGPTAAPGTNTTQFSTTAFVKAAIDVVLGGVSAAFDTLSEIAAELALKATLASPTFTGDPKAPTPSPGDNDTSIATTAFVTAAVASGGGGGVTGACGRLTLVTATPVMTTTQSAKTTIYWTPYLGQHVPIYDGTSMLMKDIGGELSVATTDTAKSPAAIGVSKVNDWFIWNDAGTYRIGHGPDWTSDTARSAGTALVMVKGVLLNSTSITNGPAAQRGTFVGTTRSNASSQLDWIFGALATNGTAGFFGVWNMYNRRAVASVTRDDTDSWTLATGNIRSANNSTTMRCSFVYGLAEDEAFSAFSSTGDAPAGGFISVGIGYDSTTVFSGRMGFTNATTHSVVSGEFTTIPLGFHFFQAMENALSGAGNATFFGDGSVPLYAQSGIYTRLML